jgi:hypothetical protein
MQEEMSSIDSILLRAPRNHILPDRILQGPTSKRARKEIRKIMKQHLSRLDKLKFTRVYEHLNGKSYRESFEMDVDNFLQWYLQEEWQLNCSCEDIFSEILSDMLPEGPTTLPKIK